MSKSAKPAAAAGSKKVAGKSATTTARSKDATKKIHKVEKKPKSKAASAPAEAPKLRVKLVRDSFTMPREDFERIARLKARAIEFKRPAKKSELLRAGLQALEKMDGPSLHAALTALTPIKTGRPKKRH
ncbi:hypothetical protein [Dokdonella sp.]|uniref:hypothetical protein n=1 Tax=Dokdonella sp. TaxID=2291710 RepID=UPI003C6AE100